MQLMTKEIEQKIPALRTTENMDPSEIDVVVKFFTPWSGFTWYATEGEKQPDGDWMFYGWVDGLYPELGPWMLSELTEVVGPMGLKIERDRGFQAKLSEVIGRGQVID
jgi:hypothetical protein